MRARTSRLKSLSSVMVSSSGPATALPSGAGEVGRSTRSPDDPRMRSPSLPVAARLGRATAELGGGSIAAAENRSERAPRQGAPAARLRH
jgi:hypothetical protein